MIQWRDGLSFPADVSEIDTRHLPAGSNAWLYFAAFASDLFKKYTFSGGLLPQSHFPAVTVLKVVQPFLCMSHSSARQICTHKQDMLLFVFYKLT